MMASQEQQQQEDSHRDRPNGSKPSFEQLTAQLRSYATQLVHIQHRAYGYDDEGLNGRTESGSAFTIQDILSALTAVKYSILGKLLILTIYLPSLHETLILILQIVSRKIVRRFAATVFPTSETFVLGMHLFIPFIYPRSCFVTLRRLFINREGHPRSHFARHSIILRHYRNIGPRVPRFRFVVCRV
jgi:hypothetical protein